MPSEVNEMGTYTPEQVAAVERLLDQALLERETFFEAWQAERRLKWTLAERLTEVAAERNSLVMFRKDLERDVP